MNYTAKSNGSHRANYDMLACLLRAVSLIRNEKFDFIEISRMDQHTMNRRINREANRFTLNSFGMIILGQEVHATVHGHGQGCMCKPSPEMVFNAYPGKIYEIGDITQDCCIKISLLGDAKPEPTFVLLFRTLSK